jgi:hypothetical protein
MDFILTIDTEADNQWDHGRALTLENIKFIPRFQELCNKYLVKPTYLVTSEVCEDSFSKELFRDYLYRDIAEIGAHLHPWTTPPYQNRDGFRFNDGYHAFASELPLDLVANKIMYLTDQVGTSFGRRPTSFRAGRYGFSENVAKMLIANQYLVDTSVTPFTSWSSFGGVPEASGGPDFLDKNAYPYSYTLENRQLIEIPVTILPTRFPLTSENFFSKLYLRHKEKNLVMKVFRKLFFNHQPLWLRPSPWMTIEMFEELIAEAERIGLPYLVMMFHSSELMPGCSRFWPDSQSIDKLYNLLEHFFVLLDYKNIPSIKLTDAAKNIRKYPEAVAFSYDEKHQ